MATVRNLNEFSSVYHAFTAIAADVGIAALEVPAGEHWINDLLPPVTRPVSIFGYGPQISRFLINPDLAGNIMTFSECWMSNKYLSTNVTLDLTAKAGASLEDVGFVGTRGITPVQNAVTLADRNDFFHMRNVSFDYIHGSALAIGVPLNTAFGYARESGFSRIRIRNCGAVGAPSLKMHSSGTGDASNNLFFDDLQVVFPHDAEGIRFTNAATGNLQRNIFMTNGMVHGIEGGSTPADNVMIGGRCSHIFMKNFSNNASSAGRYAYRFTADNQANAPFACKIEGSLPSGAGGVYVEYGKLLDLNFTTMGTTPDIKTGPQAQAPIKVTVNGPDNSISYSLDPASAGAIQRPLYASGVP